MRPIALVPVALLFAGTAAFAANTAAHPSSTSKPAAATSTANPSPDGGNSKAAHDCPRGGHGVHGKCVSAAAHSMNAARGHGQGDDANEPDDSSSAHPTAPAHPTPPPHPTPATTP
jgi:hypothetical protein